MTESNMANPSGEPSLSFREATEQRLRQEADNAQPDLQEVGAQDDTSPDPEADQRETEDDLVEESEEGQPEAGEDEEAVEEPESEWNARERELIEQAEKAEAGRKSMETDYRRKTHKLSQDSRAVESNAEEVKATAEYYANMAQQKLAQFNNVNWQELQTQPERYQQAQQAFAKAQQELRFHEQAVEQVKKRSEEMRSQHQSQVAEHSRGVLMHQIPNWGGEVYQQLRDFAEKEYDYSSDEFDEIVDWRPMKMIHDAWQATNTKKEAAKVVKKVGRKSGRRAPGKTADGQPRNAQGQFQAAREKSLHSPGDRAAFREYQQRRLELERRKKR